MLLRTSLKFQAHLFLQCKIEFGMRDPKMEPELFFGVFGKFITMVERARRENSARWRREEEALGREQQAAAEATRIRQEDTAVSSKLKGAKFDDLMSALKAGDCLSPARSAASRVGGGPSRRSRPARLKKI